LQLALREMLVVLKNLYLKEIQKKKNLEYLAAKKVIKKLIEEKKIK
jgi:hypothetical protein